MKRALTALLLITACAFAQAVVCFSEGSASIAYDMNIEILDYEKAARISVRIDYENRTQKDLKNLMFSMPANVFRRESTLPYDNDTLEKAFPFGYAPAGADIHSVSVNGTEADWAVSGENEAYIRVEANLKKGETCTVRFDYTLLFSENRAFLGFSDTDWRLTGFYPSVCVYEDGGFAQTPVTRAGESHYSEISSFHITITMPEDYLVASAQAVTVPGGAQGKRTVSIDLPSAREAALVISRKFHVKTAVSQSGVKVCAYGQDRGELKKIVRQAADAIDWFEKTIAPFPHDGFTLCLADYAGAPLSASAVGILPNTAEPEPAEIVRQTVLQYFADRVHPNPSMEAWMTDGLSHYMAIVCLRETQGEKVYSSLLTGGLLPALQITIPGGLTPVSETARFQTGTEYEAVVILRGAAALHEIESAMGRESFLKAVSHYYSSHRYSQPVSDDFVRAFNESSGKNMADAIYHWLYTIGDYAGENLYEYD